jgi:outer membrane protein OmpA-like peptidoglycan-associated protein
MPFSDKAFVNTHPAISPDGNTIVFASNLPGGKGQSDLFVSRKKSDVWSVPVPLKSLNSKKRDNYPYIHSNGDLYFSSDRKGDLDIYKCSIQGDSWSNPIALPVPINSEFDDFSIYIDIRGNSGYFSSDRNGYADLYYFYGPEEVWECDSVIEESFCYTFPSISSEELDGLPLKFEWRINGEKPIPEGQSVYCFPDIGRYTVKLNIIDTTNSQIIFTREIYEFLVERVQQPYIHVADEVRVNEWVEFDASGTYLPETVAVENEWDFGDGGTAKGVKVKHMFKHTGKYKVSLTVFGSPNGEVAPHFCSFKFINVVEDAITNENVPFNQPLDLKAFIKMIEYEPLPEDLYYLNLIGSSENVMMINFLNTEDKLELTDSVFSGFKDNSLIHIFENDDNSFSYYYGATFSLKDAYGNLVEAREAGFPNATIKNFKYTKLQSDEYFLSPMDDVYDQFAVVLKKTNEPIENYKEVFKKAPKELGEVKEIYVENEGYYYVLGESDEINDSYSAFTELKYNGFNSIRMKEFKGKEIIPALVSVASSKTENTYMIELFKVPDYLVENDSLLDIIGERKVISIRLDKKHVGYYIEGGSNLLEAKATLEKMQKLGYENALISKFSYEKLSEDGYYISAIIDNDFTYVITFDSSDTPISMDDDKYSSLIGYKIYEHYDPVSKKYYYQIDAGQNLPEAVLLTKNFSNSSLNYQQIDKLRYEPLNDDEFYLDELKDGDEQYVLVLGSFKKKQNVYKTFEGFSSCSQIREFYDEASKQYFYIVGGYESLKEVFEAKEQCASKGMEDAFIRKFVYDPMDPDQFYLKTVNEEEEIFRITLSRTSQDDANNKSIDDQFDEIRNEGNIIDSYDPETGEFVVAFNGANSLPIALDKLGDAIQHGYNSAKVQRYIYSSMDQDRFVIRDLNKEDRYFCVELFHVDSLMSPDDPLIREISRKYPISYSYNEPTKDFVYIIGPLENKEGAIEYRKMAQEDGFKDTRIMSMMFETLQHDEFYLEEIDDEVTEFVITLLRTKIKVEKDDVYFDNLPKGLEVDILKDKNTGYYNYILKSLKNIDQADSLYSILEEAGYPNARLEKLKYDQLNPDEFTLETLSESSDDFTVSLIRSKEKLGVDNPIFDEIKKEVEVFEYYNYKTKEYIYTLNKANGIISAFDMIAIAKKNGFEDAKIDRFVYSALNPDHFTLEEIRDDNTLFTIVIKESNEQLNEDYFAKLKEAGYDVREKYIPSKELWVYSIGLVDNIAEAKMISEEAKSYGYNDADIVQFHYMALNEDNYYLTKLEENETAYMLELKQADEKIDLKGEEFDNVTGVYKINEVYDPVEGKYKYYAGMPMRNEANAEAFRNELIAMGYTGTRVSKFIYTALKVDEYYLEEMEEPDSFNFVLEDKYEHEFYVYFGFDQYFLTSRAITSIKDFHEYHFNREYQILIVGHTDSIGNSDYNLWLSRKRALSVKKYLLSMGVDASKIILIAKGEAEVIFKDSKIEDYRKSRRVMIHSSKVID